MKRKKLLLILLGTIGLAATQVQFISPPQYSEDSFRSIVLKNINNYQHEVNKLVNLTEAFQQEKASLEQVQQQLSITRNAYKENEAILTYFYPEHVKAYLNGPPFEHPDPNPIQYVSEEENNYVVSPIAYKQSIPLDEIDKERFRGRNQIISPAGLQALDELVYAEEINAHKTKLVNLATDVKVYSKTIQQALTKRLFINDYEVMEASRLELIRIFTQGTTGFDTPGSLNIFEEIEAALQGTQELLQPLLKKTSKIQQQEINELFVQATASVKNEEDFNAFDRLHFLTTYINPLYKKLLEVQLTLKIKTTAEINSYIPTWNAYSENIFSEDFLNPYAYSLLKPEEDTPALRSLGKKLFEDKNLSNNRNMSCATCHQPKMAFSDRETTSFSNVEGKRVSRNSPTLLNAVYADRFFYDMRAFDLKDQATHVIESTEEYNTSYEEVLQKLNKDTDYQKAFQQSFPKQKKITRHNFSTALAAYVASLRSLNSPFDKYIRGEQQSIASEVKKGFNLFMGKANCATCHFPPTFSGLIPPLYIENESEVLGIMTHPDSLKLDADLGRMANQVMNEKLRIYKRAFKTTTVRNSELTAPYFHNGAYKTLTQVIDFYDKGGAKGKGFTYQIANQTLPADSLNLTDQEKKDLIAFLNSLTDVPSKEE